MSRKRLRGGGVEEDVSPNLIPMIDIMFLLLLFFMLGADMGHRELEDVMLPQASSIKEDKEEKGKQLERLTINIYHRYPSELQCETYASGGVCRAPPHWRIGVRGVDCTDAAKLGDLLKGEADRFRTDSKAPAMSERRVMIRADASSPYGHIQDVMVHCARVGIYQIECGAAQVSNKV